MLAQKLKELRGKRSQKAVADAIDGLSREKLSHYETGRTEPDIEMQQKLADYYNVSLDELTGRETTPATYEDILKSAQKVFSGEDYEDFEKMVEDFIRRRDVADDKDNDEQK